MLATCMAKCRQVMSKSMALRDAGKDVINWHIGGEHRSPNMYVPDRIADKDECCVRPTRF